MHDAQIRAIVPITVQIIVREPAAAGTSPLPEHNRTANARLEPQPTPTPGVAPESISTRGLDSGRNCRDGGRFALETGVRLGKCILIRRQITTAVRSRQCFRLERRR